MTTKKRLTIDWGELSMAVEDQSYEMKHFLDTESGEIVLLTGETMGYAEEDDEELERLPDWEREAVALARRIEEGYGDRYLPIEARSSHEGYRDMERFIATVKNQRARDLLSRAIAGRGAFRRFKDTLYEFPAEQKRWYAYTDHELQRCAGDWLDSHGIEPLNPAPESPDLPPEPNETADGSPLLEDLTLWLIHRSSWTEEVAGHKVRRARKGYLFEVLDALEERGLIRSSRRARSLTITEKGVEVAREIEERFGG